MKRGTLISAVSEAKRFIARAETLLESSTPTKETSYDVMYNWPTQQGAVKRSSMDLTRKLADLRLGR